jgi:hypothetical protein
LIPVIINMQYLRTALSLLFCLFFGSVTLAQRVEIGVIAGGAGYLGDLNPYNPLKISGLSGGVFTKLNLDPHFGIGLHYNYGKIEANDANSNFEQLRDRNLKFETPLHEFSFLLDFNLFDLTAYNRKTKFTPYLFVGIGSVFFKPKTTYLDEEYELRELRTEGQEQAYRSSAITFPYGVGVKYKLKESWTLFSQVGYRTALTDFLDDVSGVYPAEPRFLSDRSGEVTGVYLGEPGTQRGNFRKRDHYMFVGIGISYTFVSQKCFTF